MNIQKLVFEAYVLHFKLHGIEVWYTYIILETNPKYLFAKFAKLSLHKCVEGI